MSQVCGGPPTSESVADLIEPRPKGRSFKFKLKDDTGGTYISNVDIDEDEALADMFKKYGLRVATVKLIGKK